MSPLIKKRNAWGRWRLSWIALIGLGITFALYAFNQAPVWAEADYGFDFDRASAFLTTEETMVKNFPQPVLTGLLSFGGSACCFILGAFFAISGFAYGFITRRRRDGA